MHKALITVLTISLIGLSACVEQAKAPEASQPGTNDNYSVTQNTMQTAHATPPSDSQLAPPVKGEKIATIETDLGTIKVRLFDKLVPEMTKNFEELAASGKYNGVPFHRVVQDFMIQTGDFTDKNGMGGYSYKGPGTELPDEITPALKHLYGTVSMANSGHDTNGSQFFIVTNKNGTAFLDGGYTIFGQVYEGMDVAEQIAALQIPGTEKPSREINMKKVTISTHE